MSKVTIKSTFVDAALLELAEAAEQACKEKTPYAVQGICSATANLIAGAGVNGGSAQRNMMDAAAKVGFTPEYYGNGIRVSYFAKDGKRALFGRGQKESATAEK